MKIIKLLLQQVFPLYLKIAVFETFKLGIRMNTSEGNHTYMHFLVCVFCKQL